MKRVVVISTSLRAGSNSDMLADQFVAGAKAAGNEVEKISLVGKEIRFCKGCMGCQKISKCVQKDDVNDIMAKVLQADVVAWATPIYYYEMSGQMKTLIDRINPLFGSDYRFTDVYLLSAAAEDAAGVDARAIEGLGGFIDCFARAHFAGSVFAGGVTAPGEIAGHPALAAAREMGRKA